MVDQSTRQVSDHPGFEDAAKKLAGRVQVIEQANLGGSGGFSRSMDETVRAGQSDYVLLSDDDVEIDPEGILRAVTFADLARKPTIVGGQMFSRYERSVLHAFAEAVAPLRWWWGNAPNTKSRHDFGRRNLRNTPWLHRRADGDYNGWWMCLIPTRLIKELGPRDPGLHQVGRRRVRGAGQGPRATRRCRCPAWPAGRRRGRTRTTPSTGTPTTTCAIGSWPRCCTPDEPHGGQLISESLERQLQALLSMQYSTVALRALAIEDVLSGPGHLHTEIGTKLPQLREFRLQYADARGEADLDSFPPPRRRTPEAVKSSATPTNRMNLLTKAASGTVHQLRRPRQGAKVRPQMALPGQDAAWFVLAKLDSALVSTADNTTAAWYQRDPKLFRSLGLRSIVLHRRLRRQLAQAGRRVPCRRRRVHLARAVARDLRDGGADDSVRTASHEHCLGGPSRHRARAGRRPAGRCGHRAEARGASSWRGRDRAVAGADRGRVGHHARARAVGAGPA